MRRILGRIAATLLPLLALMLLVAEPAQAQTTRTFVASGGNDANPCSRLQPCVSFAGAFPKTSVGGEIVCLDSGSYGTVIITKSLTIECHDAFGGINNCFSTGVAIQFDSFPNTDSRKLVRLRNLNLSGIDGGFGGIQITGGAASAGSTVIIEDTVIDGNTSGTGSGRGIDDSRSGGGKLIVTNTTVRNNGGGAISVFPASGSTNIRVLLNNVRAYNSGTGAQFGNGTRVMIDNSAFDGNAGSGVLAETGAIVNVDRSTISHNANGVVAAGGSITLSNTNITFNSATGVSVSGGIVRSFGNNRIDNNAAVGAIPTLVGVATSDTGQR